MSSHDVPAVDPRSLNRRGFLRVTAVGALASAALPLINACSPASPAAPTAAPTTADAAKPAATTAPAAAATTAPAAAAPTSAASAVPAVPGTAAPAAAGGKNSLLPNYYAFKGGPKPDYHDDNPLFSDAYDNYPSQPFQAVTDAPGTGSDINVLVAAYFPVPTPYDQNPTWQFINKKLNSNVKMNIIPGADYRARFATTMADSDIPDIMHVFFGYSVAPNLPDFFKARCADLSPYLTGDAVKDYPYLAAIPTTSWKNAISAVNGGLYLIPIVRPFYSTQTSTPPGGNLYKNTDMYDTDIGKDVVPKDADDFKKILAQLNRPKENRYAIGNLGTNSALFGIGLYAEMFGAPNNWKLDSSGKLIKDRETEEYKAAVGYLRDLMQAGFFPPDVATMTNSRNDFVAKKFALSVEAQGNSWVDFWQRGLQQSPPTNFAMLPLFSATAGQKPIYFLGTGYVSMNVIKKGSPDRIKEILRVLNALAAPFGSQEDLLYTYGIEGQDYTKDAKGNPVPSTEGTQRAGYVPWRYIAQHPWVYYQADLPNFGKASYDAEHASIPYGIDDPTNGFYAPTAYGKGTVAETAFQDGIRDILLNRRPLSDYDQIVKDWQNNGGNTMRSEYQSAMAAA